MADSRPPLLKLDIEEEGGDSDRSRGSGGELDDGEFGHRSRRSGGRQGGGL